MLRLRFVSPSTARTVFLVMALLLVSTVVTHVAWWNEAQIDITAGGTPPIHYQRRGDLEVLYFTVDHATPGLLMRAAYIDLTPFGPAKVDFFVTPIGGLEAILNGTPPPHVYYQVPDEDVRPRFFTFTLESSPRPLVFYERANESYRLLQGVDFLWVHNLTSSSSNFTLAEPMHGHWIRIGTQQHLLQMYAHRVEQLRYFPILETAGVVGVLGAAILWIAAAARGPRSAPTDPEPIDMLLRLVRRGEAHLVSLRATMLVAFLLLLVVAAFGWYSLQILHYDWEWPNRLPSPGWMDRILAVYLFAQGALVVGVGVQLVTVHRELGRWRTQITQSPVV